MNESYVNSIKEIFADLSRCTPERMMAFIEETKVYLRDMKERMESGDAYVREAAINQMKEVQFLIMRQLQKICDQTGLTMAQLSDVVAATLTPAQKAIWSEADKEVAAAVAAPKEHKTKIRNILG
jgi:hypothetical protein